VTFINQSKDLTPPSPAQKATINFELCKQEKRSFYDDYNHLPLYVFCEDSLLVSYLQPGNIDGARHSCAKMV
jgi:hypothetical protein